jgi:hypothetical protein
MKLFISRALYLRRNSLYRCINKNNLSSNEELRKVLEKLNQQFNNKNAPIDNTKNININSSDKKDSFNSHQTVNKIDQTTINVTNNHIPKINENINDPIKEAQQTEKTGN